jgi:uncharacterized protein (TIGR03437 family)
LTSQAVPIPVMSVAPGIFTVGENGQGQAASVNQDGSISTPTPAGTYLEIFGTGFGSYNPPGADGLQRLVATVTATLVENPGTANATSIPLTVQYSGAAPEETSGLQQINVLIPANAPAGPQQLLLQVGNAQTQVGVTITVKAQP